MTTDPRTESSAPAVATPAPSQRSNARVIAWNIAVRLVGFARYDAWFVVSVMPHPVAARWTAAAPACGALVAASATAAPNAFSETLAESSAAGT